MTINQHRPEFLRTRSLYRPLSLAVLNKTDSERMPTGFSGLLTKEGPILNRPANANKIRDFVATEPPPALNHPWRKTIRALKRTHSFQNNYDKDVQSKKQDYTYILEDLVDDQKSEIWSTVKMIDFAHVFPADDGKVDSNYLCGIESLVKVFEDFLAETNDLWFWDVWLVGMDCLFIFNYSYFNKVIYFVLGVLFNAISVARRFQNVFCMNISEIDQIKV